MLDRGSNGETKVQKVRERITMRRKQIGEWEETFLRTLRSTAYFVA